MQQTAAVLHIPIEEIELLIDSDAIRHTLAQHGVARAKLEAARGQIPIEEADFLALPSWLLLALTVRAGQIKPGKQPRLEMEQTDPTGTTVAILEWRPGRRQLALVTMYKKGQPPKPLTSF